MEYRLIPLAATGFLLAGISGDAHAADDATIPQGRETFVTYCAPCHGPEGAGLLAPNLTDAEVLHGESLAEIIKVIGEGVPARSMPLGRLSSMILIT